MGTHTTERPVYTKREEDVGAFPPEEPPTSVRRDFSHLEPPREARGRLARYAVLALAVTDRELRQRTVDHRAGFLLSLIDGETTVEGILDLSAMPADETLSLLEDLVKLGMVVARSSSRKS